MALVADLILVGIPAKEANVLGDTFGSYGATGTTISDATAFTDSLVYVITSTGANAGLKLPKVDASAAKRHIVFNEVANVTRVYLADTAVESIKLFGAATGAATYVNVPANGFIQIFKLADNVWGALR